MLWATDNNSADTIRQLKESNSRLESRLNTATAINESQYNRITALQAAFNQLRESIANDVNTVAIIENRELGDKTVIERSLARVEQIERIVDEIGKANQ